MATNEKLTAVQVDIKTCKLMCYYCNRIVKNPLTCSVCPNYHYHPSCAEAAKVFIAQNTIKCNTSQQDLNTKEFSTRILLKTIIVKKDILIKKLRDKIARLKDKTSLINQIKFLQPDFNVIQKNVPIEYNLENTNNKKQGKQIITTALVIEAINNVNNNNLSNNVNNGVIESEYTILKPPTSNLTFKTGVKTRSASASSRNERQHSDEFQVQQFLVLEKSDSMRKNLIAKLRKEGDFCTGEAVPVQEKQVTSSVETNTNNKTCKLLPCTHCKGSMLYEDVFTCFRLMKMVRTYHKKTQRAFIDEEAVKSAITDVIKHKKSIRVVAADHNLKSATLQHRIEKYRKIHKNMNPEVSDDSGQENEAADIFPFPALDSDAFVVETDEHPIDENSRNRSRRKDIEAILGISVGGLPPTNHNDQGLQEVTIVSQEPVFIEENCIADVIIEDVIMEEENKKEQIENGANSTTQWKQLRERRSKVLRTPAKSLYKEKSELNNRYLNLASSRSKLLELQVEEAQLFIQVRKAELEKVLLEKKLIEEKMQQNKLLFEAQMEASGKK
ncbi:hypothetical protein RN001_005635 [Aquatica leii]|uniref:Uncharacterized protein n=1 Tax=Aquatica leii TaxID=1421715 RepID=A0AAN7SAP4_9COLE|nr:hypothetical protein RN001_005635 [Aquatica leii]